MKERKTYQFEKQTIKEFEELKKENEVSYEKMLKMLINNFKQNGDTRLCTKRGI